VYNYFIVIEENRFANLKEFHTFDQSTNNQIIQNMNKSDLIGKMSADAGITKTQAQTALSSFIEATTDALKSNDKVILVGFGTFSTSVRSARKGRNPQTGAEINIAEKKVVRFKPGAELSGKVK
jgi:DNA-binding protein HU-beta